GEELSDLACLLRTCQVEEAVHLVVGDVGQQSLSGGAGVQRATGVGAGDECEAGGFFADEVGEDDGVPDAHPDEDGAAEQPGPTRPRTGDQVTPWPACSRARRG